MRFGILLFLFLPQISFAQLNEYSGTYPDRLSALFEEYSRSIGEGAAIYNGPEYSGTDLSIAGHPFFLSRAFTYGSVVYMGYRYDSLVLAYDTHQDELVVAYPEQNNFFAIIPRKNRIDSFRIHRHQFIHVRNPEAHPGIVEAGYYDLLYNGDHTVLSKRVKKTASYREGDYLSRFEPDHDYFIRKDGEFHLINRRSAILTLFKEHKRELRKYIRERNLDFKNQPDQFLLVLGKYLDEL